MAARAAVFTLLEGDSVLQNLGFGKIYASNSIDSPDEEKFIVIRWEERTMFVPDRGPQSLTIWAHTRDRDYGDIDEVLERVKHLFGEVVQRPGADGWILTQADWVSDSSDLVDNGFNTLTRNSAFRVVSRYATSEQGD